MKLDRQLLPALALLVAAAAWGSTVAVAKGAYEHMSPVSLTISRLLLTAICLVIPFLPHLRMKRETLIHGVILGMVFNFGLAIQLIGLEYTAPSLSGFITASYVVFTAIITAVFLRQRSGARTWIAVALTISGIAILALGHGGEGGFGYGAVLTLIGAVMFAVHIVLLGRWVTPETVQSLTLAQALTGAAGCLIVIPFVQYEVPTTWDLALPVLYLGIFCGAVTLFLQSWAQSYVPATTSAIIMCSEPVWAAGFAIGFGMEQLTWQVLVGGFIVVAALLLIAWPKRESRRIDEVVQELRQRFRR
ncbi:DMT family transporter [Arachnia propionica]|uniref:DMT family transporter n=1 Tax=Arachnia propionica TaxID=1750 RepID=A0A3P1WZ91_9ACTN|nr:DMT family transporter [Arachnia propionica]RRD50987.1 DMT family transporter [Arachnia propionica]